jgi:hypothetical protein
MFIAYRLLFVGDSLWQKSLYHTTVSTVLLLDCCPSLKKGNRYSSVLWLFQNEIRNILTIFRTSGVNVYLF